MLKGMAAKAAAALVAGALMAGAAAADLTADQEIQVVKLKIDVQAAKQKAAESYDSAESGATKDTLKAVLARLDDIYSRLEHMLDNR
jgi:hypothetical protein